MKTAFINNQMNRTRTNCYAIKILLIIICIGIVAGCFENPEKKLMNRAMKDPKGPAAKEYVAQYPNGENVVFLKNMLESDAWSRAKETGTVESLLGYLEEYPEGSHTFQIEQALRNLLFGASRSKEQSEDPRLVLERYLDLRPDGKFAAQAAAAIDNLNWLEVNLIDTLDSYSTYLSKGKLYHDEAIKQIRARQEMPDLRLGMTTDEVESLLGPPTKEDAIYKGVSTSGYGRFYAMRYPDLGITCNVRKRKQWAKIFSLAFREPFSSKYQGISIGMTKEEVIAILGEPPDLKRKDYVRNDLEMFYPKDYQNDHRTGISVLLSGRYPNQGEYRDLNISTDKNMIKNHLIKYNNVKLLLDRAPLAVALSGERIYVKRNYGVNRVIEISDYDHKIHGAFVILSVPK